MTVLARVSIAVATMLAAGVAIAQVSDSLKIEVTRVDGGYRVRYQDPDFNNRPMEVFVRDASRLHGAIVGTVSRAGADNTWRYDYEAFNLQDSDQHLASWSMQVQTGSEVAASPVGWKSSIDREGISLFTTSATGSDQVPPGSSRRGWSILSDSLPEVKEAAVRGSAQLDVDSADLPAHVRRRLVELERGNNLRVSVIVPWIPTRQIARGYEGPIDPGAILRRVAFGYQDPLLQSVAPDIRDGRAQVAEIFGQLQLAQTALANNNKAAALDAVRTAERLLDRVRVSEDRKEIPAAFKVILEYALTRIR
jgi:hypothetical protein